MLIDADYTLDENGAVVRLYCKNQKGKTILVLNSTFKPYFLAMPKKNVAKLKKKIESLNEEEIGTKILKVEVVEKIWENKNEKLLKIIIDNPRKISAVRDAIKNWEEVKETYEYDIPFTKRFIIDNQLEPMGWIEVIGEKVEGKNEFQVDSVVQAMSIK